MPSTLEATKMFLDAKILYGPAKAANAGGVATSGLEERRRTARAFRGPARKWMTSCTRSWSPSTATATRRPRIRHARQPGKRRQHRRLPESSRRNAGPRLGVETQAVRIETGAPPLSLRFCRDRVGILTSSLSVLERTSPVITGSLLAQSHLPDMQATLQRSLLRPQGQPRALVPT